MSTDSQVDLKSIRAVIGELIKALEANADGGTIKNLWETLRDAIAPDPGRTGVPVSQTTMPDALKVRLEKLLTFLNVGWHNIAYYPDMALDLLRDCVLCHQALTPTAGTAKPATITGRLKAARWPKSTLRR